MTKWIMESIEKYAINLPYQIFYMGIPMDYPYVNISKTVRDSVQRNGWNDKQDLEKGKEWVFQNLDAILFCFRYQQYFL